MGSTDYAVKENMDLKKTALILEGGGLRGVYTSGVLHYFMEKDLYFPYVIGVSMGACNAASYVSRQLGRNRIVNIRYIHDKRYFSYRSLLRRGELFGMHFIFNTIPYSLVPFDFETFNTSGQQCVTVVTDCETGEAVYYEKDGLGPEYMTVLQASSSLPFVAQPVRYRGRILMDGGLADSVPIGKSIADGNKRHVIVLTRPKGYRKSRSIISGKISRLRYRNYPGLCENIEKRSARYNKTMEFIEELEARGAVFIVRPRKPIEAGRIERSQAKLYAAYDQGYEDAVHYSEALSSYLRKE